ATLRRAVGTGKLLNDDPGPLARRGSIGDASVEEGRTGTRAVRLTVSLSAVSTKKTTVKFTTANGTAVNTSDYTKTSGTITIPAGTASAVISVSVQGDTTRESSETFKVTLSAPVGAALGRSAATATIHNDD
ncbi:MAG TPA: Calx-beta domain-containing protein, partial [Acidimicrobiia bacterium]|nr:Calx-beta domain-containing protein [Acidimicrobiia bacterium]